MQGRGFLTGAIKTVEDVPVQQRSHNPRMAEANFEKVTCHVLHPGIEMPSSSNWTLQLDHCILKQAARSGRACCTQQQKV